VVVLVVVVGEGGSSRGYRLGSVLGGEVGFVLLAGWCRAVLGLEGDVGVWGTEGAAWTVGWVAAEASSLVEVL
jgi:hypothetical protein